MKNLRLVLPLLASAALCAAASAPTSAPAPAADAAEERLIVRVEAIRDIPGELGAAVFNSKRGYPVHLDQAYEAEWVKLEPGQKAVEFVFESLSPGEYAVSVVHDSIPNRKVDRSAVGFPKEGVGFSNDQKVTLKAPSYAKSKFTLKAGEEKKIVIRLDYRD